MPGVLFHTTTRSDEPLRLRRSSVTSHAAMALFLPQLCRAQLQPMRRSAAVRLFRCTRSASSPSRGLTATTATTAARLVHSSWLAPAAPGNVLACHPTLCQRSAC